MTPVIVVAALFCVVTLALVCASGWLARRGRDGSVRPDVDAYAQPQPAPWEREGGADLTSPAVVAAPPVVVAQPPEGARFRAAGEKPVNGQIIDDVARGLEKIPPLPRALQLILR